MSSSISTNRTEPTLSNAQTVADSNDSQLPIQASGTPLRHSLFRYGEGDIILQINDSLLETHKHVLRKFSKLDTIIPDTTGLNTLSLPMNGCTVNDFQNAFKILYASVVDGPFTFDSVVLTSALCLATTYDYPGLRAFAIENLQTMSLSAIERIRLARNFNIESWEEPAYAELHERDAPITFEEAAILGLETFVQVAEAREREQRRKWKDVEAGPPRQTQSIGVGLDTVPRGWRWGSSSSLVPALNSPKMPMFEEKLATLRAKDSARKAQVQAQAQLTPEVTMSR